MSEIKFKIIEKIGVLSKSALALSAVEGSGWAKEVTPTAFGTSPKFDREIF